MMVRTPSTTIQCFSAIIILVLVGPYSFAHANENKIQQQLDVVSNPQHYLDGWHQQQQEELSLIPIEISRMNVSADNTINQQESKPTTSLEDSLGMATQEVQPLPSTESSSAVAEMEQQPQHEQPQTLSLLRGGNNIDSKDDSPSHRRSFLGAGNERREKFLRRGGGIGDGRMMS